MVTAESWLCNGPYVIYSPYDQMANDSEYSAEKRKRKKKIPALATQLYVLRFSSFLIMDVLPGSYQNLTAEPTSVVISISQPTCYVYKTVN